MATWLITGANRGIGLALCQQARARGEDVIGACRTASTELKALGVDVVEGVDVAKASGAEALSRATEGRRVDVLIHRGNVLPGSAATDVHGQHRRGHAALRLRCR